VKAITAINLVAVELGDPFFGRWSKLNLLSYLNDGQRAVVLVRPDANAITASVQLVAGTKQALPAGGLRLLDVVRNMGADGATPGAPVHFIDGQAQKDFAADWHTQAQAGVIDDVAYDPDRNPTVYYTVPPAKASAPQTWVEIVYSKTPTDVTDPDNGDITLSDVYGTPIIEWMFYRAYAVNVGSAGSQQRSQQHLATFSALMGLKIKLEQFLKPKEV
jgi:hypothetical protein